MTDHITPEKARELAGTLDLTQYAEHSDALMSLAAQVEHYRAALEEIANMDYRGNRSVEQATARRALGMEL